MTPVEFIQDGMTLLWPRLFDGAVSPMMLLPTPSIASLDAKEGRRPSLQSERLPRRCSRFRAGLSPTLGPGNFPEERAPEGTALGDADAGASARRGAPRWPSLWRLLKKLVTRSERRKEVAW